MFGVRDVAWRFLSVVGEHCPGPTRVGGPVQILEIMVKEHCYAARPGEPVEKF